MKIIWKRFRPNPSMTRIWKTSGQIQVLLILFFLNKIILSIKTKKIILLDNFGDSANQHVINLNINIQSQKFKVSIQKRGLF